MIAWQQVTHHGGRDLKRFDAQVGHLHVGCEDNGEGWFNWWIALAPQGPAPGDFRTLDTGGESSERLAKARVRRVAKRILMRALRDL